VFREEGHQRVKQLQQQRTYQNKINDNIQRGSPINLNCFSVDSSIHEDELEFEDVYQEKNLGARQEPTTNSTLIWHQDGIEPGTHWWKASALTTASSLLPKRGLRWKNEVKHTDEGFLRFSNSNVE